MKSCDAMWVIIHMAHTEERAEAVVELLTREGFMVKSRPVARAVLAGSACFEVMALTSEAKEARDFLQEMGC